MSREIKKCKENQKETLEVKFSITEMKSHWMSLITEQKTSKLENI